MVRGKPLVYLDSAATTQKPRAVLDALARYYAHGNANIHRGVYVLSEEATAAYDAARAKVQRFVNAAASREIVFTRNSTEGINLVAQSFGRRNIGPGDEIVITHMEHHSTSCPGSCSASRSARGCAWCRSTTAARCSSTSWKGS